MTYEELRIITKDVCRTLNDHAEGENPLNNGLFPICTAQDTDKLARDIFISFSEEPNAGHAKDVDGNVELHKLEEMKAEMNGKIDELHRLISSLKVTTIVTERENL